MFLTNIIFSRYYTVYALFARTAPKALERRHLIPLRVFFWGHISSRSGGPFEFVRPVSFTKRNASNITFESTLLVYTIRIRVPSISSSSSKRINCGTDGSTKNICTSDWKKKSSFSFRSRRSSLASQTCWAQISVYIRLHLSMICTGKTRNQLYQPLSGINVTGKAVFGAS